MPQPLRFPIVSPHMSAHSILCACGELKAAIDAAQTNDELRALLAIARDAWNQIEAVVQYAGDADDQGRN